MGRWDGDVVDWAEFDRRSAHVFGRPLAEAETKPIPWRTGPVGEETWEEYDLKAGLTFHRFSGAREREVRRQVAETDRQIQVERRLLRDVSARGWEAVRASATGTDSTLVESVRARLGGGSATALRESAGAALLTAGERVAVREATAVAPTRLGGRRIKATLITPGAGSSGYYPAETLQQAARDRVFGKGLHIYTDHPSATEAMDRPERSVRDLAGRLTEDARWDPSVQALVAEAEIFPAFAELVTALEGVIGMSIRAQGDVEAGTVDGRPVRKITRLVNAESVDLVTKAGRGGTYEVLESRRTRWAS